MAADLVDTIVTVLICVSAGAGFITAALYAWSTSKIELADRRGRGGGSVDLEMELTLTDSSDQKSGKPTHVLLDESEADDPENAALIRQEALSDFASRVGAVTANDDEKVEFSSSSVPAASAAAKRSAVSAASAPPQFVMSVREISDAIAEGATSFLHTEYAYMAGFIVLFAAGIFVALGSGGDTNAAGSSSEDDDGTVPVWRRAGYTCAAFIIGALTSVLSGYIGMKIAVYANGRTAIQAQNGVGPAFGTAFRAGAVMGFALVSLGVFSLLAVVAVYRTLFEKAFSTQDATKQMFEAVAGFGLGGSCVALFGRVGGGIYTKAADVGADLVGKLEAGIPEDDPRNPAVIADNVGDNVGDIAGMGADLFGSFAESSCAFMLLAAQSELFNSWSAVVFPLLVIACGILVSILTAQYATRWFPVRRLEQVDTCLRRQLLISTAYMTPVAMLLALLALPQSFKIHAALGTDKLDVANWMIGICVISGLWSGMIIGYATDYYTSFAHNPVREVAHSCNTGAATNIIYGLALGYKSTIFPAICLVLSIFASYSLASLLGVSSAAIGILSTLCTGLTIDAYGPISDNAGGIAEMAHLGPEVRAITDGLDAAGNTTAAIGKGFAIGSAALVSLSLFGAFVATANLGDIGVNLLRPLSFGGLLWGAMLPYWFSALTMKSVGRAALAMVEEVRRQFAENSGIMAGTQRPQYARCVAISTRSSLREMIAPSILVLATPVAVGFLIGSEALAGVLAGALVSGVHMAVSAANTGGAWDNAKKYIEAGNEGGRGSPQHKAAIVGDTVGDPLKDTSGPSLNILIKLMAIVSVVFAPAVPRSGLLVRIF